MLECTGRRSRSEHSRTQLSKHPCLACNLLTPIQAEQSNLEVTRVVYSFPVPSQAEQKLIPEILNTAPKGRHRGCD